MQLLRGIAAFCVAFLHLAYAFADHIGNGLQASFGPASLGQIAVLTFFIISGFIMVVSAQPLFGKTGARTLFWKRRFIRILPPYWIATALLAVILTVLFNLAPEFEKLGLSLVLVPYWPEGDSLRAVPFLWVGWTLFYELLFYLVFGLWLARGMTFTIIATSVCLILLVIAGHFIPAENAFAFSATRPVLCAFIFGMILAVVRSTFCNLSAWTALAGVVLFVCAIFLIPQPKQESAMGFDYLLWAGLPAILLTCSALVVSEKIPMKHAVTAFGDMSYALYLLHLPVAWAWLWFYPKLPFFDAGPWDYLLTVLIVTLTSSWVFYLYIERPLTGWLNRKLTIAKP